MRRDDIDLRHPPAAGLPWGKIAKTIAYSITAAAISFIVLTGAGFWPFFATVLAFIFGPRLWKRV